MLEQYIEAMFKEDIPTRDITTDAIFTNQETKARLIAKQDGVICGLKEFTKVMHYVDETLVIVLHVSEGDQVETGILLAEIIGRTGRIHGESIVTIPAINANSNSSIMIKF